MITNGKKILLDIGGGVLDQNKIERYRRYLGDDYNSNDYWVLDRKPLPGVKTVCDLTEGLPIKTASVDEIICVHVLEHLPDLEGPLTEIHRILKPGGTLKIWVPHYFSSIAFGDSTHVRFFTFETLSQFDKRSGGSYYYDTHFVLIQSRIPIFRRWYKPRLHDRVLEAAINKNPRKGERFLKILPYKEWEIYTEFQKEA
jgi:SAM-dependent methyltransferase